jgi:hypothetical protein
MQPATSEQFDQVKNTNETMKILFEFVEPILKKTEETIYFPQIESLKNEAVELQKDKVANETSIDDMGTKLKMQTITIIFLICVICGLVGYILWNYLVSENHVIENSEDDQILVAEAEDDRIPVAEADDDRTPVAEADDDRTPVVEGNDRTSVVQVESNLIPESDIINILPKKCDTTKEKKKRKKRKK